MRIELMEMSDEVLRGAPSSEVSESIRYAIYQQGLTLLRYSIYPKHLARFRLNLHEAILRTDLLIMVTDDLPSFRREGKNYFDSLQGTPIGEYERALLFSSKKGALVLIDHKHPLPDDKLFEMIFDTIKEKTAREERVISTSFQLVGLDTVEFPEKGASVEIVKKDGLFDVRIFSCHEKRVIEAAKAFENKYGAYIYSRKGESLALVTQRAMVKESVTAAIAESCSGGKVATKITANSGCSDFFLASAVTYSDFAKEKLLGVSKETLISHGAVSEEAVCEMVKGLCESVDPHIAIALSGISGPAGGSADKPVGTLWLGVQLRGERTGKTKLFKLDGERAENMETAANIALGLLWRYVTSGETF